MKVYYNHELFIGSALLLGTSIFLLSSKNIEYYKKEQSRYKYIIGGCVCLGIATTSIHYLPKLLK